MIKLPWNDRRFVEIWDFYKLYRKNEHRFKFKSIQSEQTALNSLFEKAGGDLDTAIAIIRRTAENGWKGLFAFNTSEDGRYRNIKTGGTSEARINALKNW